MELQKKTDFSRYNVEQRDAYRGLTDEQYSRLISYLKNGYDCLKVVDDKGVSSEVTVDSLIELLESNNNIREIIIERISLNEATIHRLILEGDQRFAPPSTQKEKTSKVLPFREVKIEPIKKQSSKKATSLESRIQSLLEPMVNEGSAKQESTQKQDAHLTQLRISRNQQLSSDLFFRLKNHHEAFRLGTKYIKDVDAGLNVFGFHGEDKDNGKRNSIYGLMAFMTYQRGFPVVAILGEQYSEIMAQLQVVYGEKSVVADTYLDMKCERIDNIYLVSRDDFYSHQQEKINQFKKITKETRTVVLVDLPSCTEVEMSMGSMLPLCRMIDSFTFVMDTARASMSQVRKDLHFMRCYGFEIKGFILKDN